MLTVQFILEIHILECWTQHGTVGLSSINSVDTRFVPTEAEYIATSCARVNVSPPVICIFIAFRRCRGWISRRKEFQSCFVPILSPFSVSQSKRLFLETTTSYRTFWTQTLFSNIKLKKDRCKQAWIRSVYTWEANSPCTAVRWHGPGTENVLVDFGSECYDWGAIVSNSFLQNPWQLS